MDMPLIEGNISLSSLVDALQGTYGVVFTRGIDDTTTDCRDLTTTEEGVTHMTAIHKDMAFVHTTVVNVATTEDTARVVEAVGAVTIESLVIQFLLVVVITDCQIVPRVCRLRIKVAITYKAVI